MSPYQSNANYTQAPWASVPFAPRAYGIEEAYREKQQSLTFVLIHGSWADASFWDGIASALRKKGHLVYAPEYIKYESNSNKAITQTHAMLSKSIADFITSNHLQNIILVGHSFGGSLVQKVAELVPSHIKRLVFLNAFVLNDGQSVADEFPPAAQATFQQLRQSTKDDTILLPFYFFRETFVNLASLNQAQQLYDRVAPEPAKPFYEKLDLKKFYSLTLPKSYVYLTEDNALPQSNKYGWHPHMSGRLGLFRLIKGQGDHFSTVKTEPSRVAQKIYEAARD
ncbi:alpha/beta hydrolase [Paenibacillus sp. SYP-B3998]|uniref:Alpha/beta hydrolase n=2 Tax=Paenibacillus sp. SYP-B3998 TaxID=2678564 RepID=A0A6G3ZU64_9BACL|nr:alpha/beta hydrolase [Paenibacillus sp. SYP-B3998]